MLQSFICHAHKRAMLHMYTCHIYARDTYTHVSHIYTCYIHEQHQLTGGALSERKGEEGGVPEKKRKIEEVWGEGGNEKQKKNNGAGGGDGLRGAEEGVGQLAGGGSGVEGAGAWSTHSDPQAVMQVFLRCLVVRCGVLLCVVVGLRVLRCLVVCCGVVLCVAVSCCVLRCVFVCCGVLWCFVVSCGVLRCLVVCCNVSSCVAVYLHVLRCVFMCYSVLCSVAVSCENFFFCGASSCVAECRGVLCCVTVLCSLVRVLRCEVELSSVVCTHWPPLHMGLHSICCNKCRKEATMALSKYLVVCCTMHCNTLQRAVTHTCITLTQQATTTLMQSELVGVAEGVLLYRFN